MMWYAAAMWTAFLYQNNEPCGLFEAETADVAVQAKIRCRILLSTFDARLAVQDEIRDIGKGDR